MKKVDFFLWDLSLLSTHTFFDTENIFTVSSEMFKAVSAKAVSKINLVGVLTILSHFNRTFFNVSTSHCFGWMLLVWAATVDISIHFFDLKQRLNYRQVIQTRCFVSGLMSLSWSCTASIARLSDFNIGLCGRSMRHHHLRFHFHVFLILFARQS